MVIEPAVESEDSTGAAETGSTDADPQFSPARALEAVGDRWGLLIFRDALFKGTTTFDEFVRHAGVTADVVADRLDGFVGAGLMQETSGERDTADRVYVLTQKGRNVEPVIIALITWADGWTVPIAQRAAFAHETRIEDALRAAQLDPDAADIPTPISIEVSLLGSFTVRVVGKTIDSLSIGSQRLLAFLALHDRPVARSAMAGTMWPEVSEERAGLSLRAALSRLETSAREAILVAAAGLRLADTVAVDLRDAQALARRLLSPGPSLRDADLSPDAVAVLSLELLPDWYDDWVADEAEDWRQLRMSALESLARVLMDAGRLAEAAAAARAAIKAEPLRESAQASLMRIHLAEGNQTEALRVFDRYSAHLRMVLDLKPTAQLAALIADLRSSSG